MSIFGNEFQADGVSSQNLCCFLCLIYHPHTMCDNFLYIDLIVNLDIKARWNFSFSLSVAGD